MDLDYELLASIASGGLGSWVSDAAGSTVYVKSDDCVGEPVESRAPGRQCQPSTARRRVPPPGLAAACLPPPNSCLGLFLHSDLSRLLHFPQAACVICSASFGATTPRGALPFSS